MASNNIPRVEQDLKRSSITAAQNMLNQQVAAGSTDAETELRGVSAGQVADLVLIQQQQYSTPYDPIDPFALPNSQMPPPAEAGRLETRLYSLKEKLKQKRT